MRIFCAATNQTLARTQLTQAMRAMAHLQFALSPTSSYGGGRPYRGTTTNWGAASAASSSGSKRKLIECEEAMNWSTGRSTGQEGGRMRQPTNN